jgi:natural product biosynthesis luciferase-like monooxygenase protein
MNRSRLPLNPTQQAMVLHALSGAEPGTDIEQIVIYLHESLDIEGIERVWQGLIEEHETLRVRFDWSESPAVQEVCPVWRLKMERHDLTNLESAEVDARFEDWLANDRRKGFDLAQIPLMRLAYFDTGEGAGRLVWTFHHAILDGRSFTLLMQEAFRRYDASSYREGQKVDWGDYASYLDWVQNATDVEESRAFWREKLHEFTRPVELNFAPSSLDTGGEETHGQCEVVLSEEETRALEVLAQAHDATLNSVVQSAWSILLQQYSGQDDIVFGVARACRKAPVRDADRIIGVMINTVPIRFNIAAGTTVADLLRAARREQVEVRPYENTPLAEVHAWSQVEAGKHLFETLLVFENYDLSTCLSGAGSSRPRRSCELREQTNYALTLYAYAGSQMRLKLAYARRRAGAAAGERMLKQLAQVLKGMAAGAGRQVSEIPMLSEAETQKMLFEWNDTKTDVDGAQTIHRAIERQVAATPQNAAVACREEIVSYASLNERANRLARVLRRMGVSRDEPVGVMIDRSIEMVVALLAILKAGGAYVPLDPAYPSERIALMLEDSGAKVLVARQPGAGVPLSSRVSVLDIDNQDLAKQLGREDASDLEDVSDGASLAYIIYTSGSTGRPKGVMVEHRNVRNFFAGMDQRLGTQPGVWMAVTSISFDISVLELFWTLSRGFKVVLVKEEDRLLAPHSPISKGRGSAAPGFSLFYFASDLGGDASTRYRLLLEGAKFGDENGFEAVWTPERHFHTFGGLYSNPSVAGAALAAITSRIGIRAGSVVSPLHHPVRLAEEWALVDNLSGGRVGVSFASGWQANDFVFAPENFRDRKRIMFENIDTVKRLWRGEVLMYRGGNGQEAAVRIFPTPIQKELPVWVTAAGNPETFEQAGACGANLLTHLLGQKFDDVEAKIAIYRSARRKAGWEGRGRVTLMLHTFVGTSMETVKEAVREPMCRYLETSLDLIRNAPFAFPTFKAPSEEIAQKVTQGLKDFSGEEMRLLLGFAFERYFETSGLFGTVERCVEIVRRCAEADVNEIACLIDFGVPTEEALEGLVLLNEVRKAVTAASGEDAPERAEDYSILAQMARHRATHLQCTPSLLRILTEQKGGLEAVGTLARLMVGGEALPADLMNRLRKVMAGEIHNMYGPTETTVWSTTDMLRPDETVVTIGQPIANTTVFIVDRHLRPLPVGLPGELLIGGDGVVRGYFNRPDLTAERFVHINGIAGANGRLYRTGDLAAWREDGRIEFLGRLDHQVKIRGHRIEMGEIEHAMGLTGDVRTAAVVPKERRQGEWDLVAFYVSVSGGELDEGVLRQELAARLPDYMIPSVFVKLDALPLTPNGKVDRKTLMSIPLGQRSGSRKATGAVPESEMEKQIAAVFGEALDLDGVGLDQNFFDLGANSLMLVRVASKLGEIFPGRVGLVDLFQRTTVRSLADFLNSRDGGVAPGGSSLSHRGRQRREALLRRRG